MLRFAMPLLLSALAAAAHVHSPPAARLAIAANARRAGPIVLAAKAKPVDAAGEPIKAALSSYMFFCADRRPSLTQELKASKGADFKNTLVLTELGAEWKTLPEGDKTKYVAHSPRSEFE